uniref:Uncharacterized protein n=1 Tax=Arundo donax TaxID=35708 RepID=A0A0A9A7W7_ARUDO
MQTQNVIMKGNAPFPHLTLLDSFPEQQSYW